MIEQQKIYDLVASYLVGKAVFIVDVTVSPDNSIVVEIDSNQGVTIDECVALNQFLESKLDRDIEDFDLEVGSAGLSAPFKVLQQYEKNVGNEVEVVTRKGEKYTGVLESVFSDGFTIVIEEKVREEGAKRKKTVERVLQFAFEEVKKTNYLIRFK
ncbi:ribosome assembly cofactor RimP [Microbacter margulisiae]|uniref:Ribosome maturation factor RimP n=1 Tax=Microbacter margulisiae TaxID=1350067 RepID=A0A7W5DSC9_9PORP|nr:ribosome assembly cofactor RimP [Microbacter margulisiae]MBB3188174.1 ribosome maturation factor RimP [Microbacter margulisiae]